jgi:DNA-binding Xre family transcriptional regulator
MHTMSIDTKWFKNRLLDRQVSQRQLARRIGLDPAAVSLMLRGQRRMQLSEAAAIARELGCSLNDVLEHAGIEVGGVHPPAHQQQTSAPQQAVHGAMASQVITLPDGHQAVLVILH